MAPVIDRPALADRLLNHWQGIFRREFMPVLAVSNPIMGFWFCRVPRICKTAIACLTTIRWYSTVIAEFRQRLDLLTSAANVFSVRVRAEFQNSRASMKQLVIIDILTNHQV